MLFSGYPAVASFAKRHGSVISNCYIMRMFTAQRFSAAKRTGIFSASAMLITTNAAYDSAFAATTAGRGKTATTLIKRFFVIHTFEGTVLVGKVMNFTSFAQIVGGVVAGIAANYNFFDSSYNTHFKFFLPLKPWIFKKMMVDVLGKLPDEPGNEPKQKY